PRKEAPVLNARIRKAWLAGAKVARIGAPADLTYDVIDLGEGRDMLGKLAAMDHSDKHDTPGVMIIGQGAINGPDGEAVLATALNTALAAQSKVLILHTAASRVGGMDIGFATEGGVDAALDGAEVVYNLGADEIDIAPGAFVVYQGSHGDRGAHRADVILPGASYTEEPGLFVNTEGRPQEAVRANFAPGEAKDNWAILRALSAELDATLPYNSLRDLRAKLFEAVPHLAAIDAVPENTPEPLDVPGPLGDGVFESPVTDHYLTNPIARASTVMAELSQLAADRDLPVAAE
ncbi:MAG: molybdopterin-dependent oxidoreductase, partial [Pseudomonadota bacterium]